uniref:Similarity n=1 Tax=Microcystis aeruginosa (strain PCC 7806) TaxID=267872 RepID=A8YCE1_MICA7|nr:unnamed protein product [Microcystis aeruginosa PCC 7806]
MKDFALYSLEKLIEWKLSKIESKFFSVKIVTLYSLEKLIEWKLKTSLF